MSVSIKVAIRCRPFTIDDRLGVQLVQNGEEAGEVNLINSQYTTNRFAFSWAWWSAYGYQRHATVRVMRILITVWKFVLIDPFSI
jgi:hypothetical protein